MSALSSQVVFSQPPDGQKSSVTAGLKMLAVLAVLSLFILSQAYHDLTPVQEREQMGIFPKNIELFV